MITTLTKGALFENSARTLYRLLEVFQDRAAPVAYVLNMDVKRPFPRELSLDELSAKFAATELRPTSTGGRMSRTPVSVTDVEFAIYRGRRDLIAPLVNDERIYKPEHRARLMTARANEMDTSVVAVLVCLRLYWRGGMTFDALVPAFQLCGGMDLAVKARHGSGSAQHRPSESGNAL